MKARGGRWDGEKEKAPAFSLSSSSPARLLFLLRCPAGTSAEEKVTKPNLVDVRPWSRSVYLPFIGQIQRYTAQTFVLTKHVSQNSYRGKQHENDSHSKVNDPAVVLRLCHLVLNRQNLSMTYNEPNQLFHSKSQ